MNKSTQDLVNASQAQPPGEQQLCPLSFAQERLWFLDQLHPGNPVYNIPQAWKLEGDLNLAAFQRALNEVIRRHETLRTTFGRVEGKPVEIIAAFESTTLNVLDFSNQGDPNQAVEQAIQHAARLPFNLHDGPLFRTHLFRLSPSKHTILFNLHHIIADAWSFEILRREVSELYPAFCAGREVELSELPIQYLDYAAWQREQWCSQSQNLEFWKQHLSGVGGPLELPYDFSRGSIENFAGASKSFEISPELTHSLRTIAQREGATLFHVLFTAFNAYLHRITGQNGFTIGMPVSGRDRVETENLIGLFVNTIALHTDTSGNPTFLELLHRVRDTAFAALAHQDIPFEEVVKALQPERTVGRNPLFQVVFALHGGYPTRWELGDLQAATTDVETGTAKFDWTFLLAERDSGIRGRFEYATDLFAADSIEHFLDQFHLLLEGIAANPSRRILEFPLLNEAERELVLSKWNQTATNYERNATIHELFETQAAKTPTVVALKFFEQQLTYRELNERANQLARLIQKSGVKPGALVGVALDRSPELIISLLAVLKAGAAYVPLDRSYPVERLRFMIEDAGVNVLVTDFDSKDESRLWNNHSQPLQVIALNETVWRSESTENLPSNTSNTDAGSLAYVIYTSGSTGAPKGAAIPHRGVVRLVRSTNYAMFSPSDTFLQLAPASFDASTFEIWGSLLNGARLVIFLPHTPSLEELGRVIQREQVTTLWLTAGLFHQMIDHQLTALKSVRQLLAGGDVLSVSHVQKIIHELPDCTLINGYGPTENTTFTCCYRVPTNWSGGKSVPIGKPISNTRVYVLDETFQPVPIGVPGELFIAGDGLAKEYLNRPELNREKFLAVPTLNEPKLYRTGDRVRWLTDGNIEFLGRKDQQLKIRGFRIEPGEIEAALVSYPMIQQAAVKAVTSTSGDRQLAAYVTILTEGDFDSLQLRAFLETKLPGYMIPSHFIALENLPLTPNGKVDYRALPDPNHDTEPGHSGTPPRNLTEETLAKIWREVLGRNSFGVHDNFFQLGGHSLLATQIISRIARAFEVEVPVRAMFEVPTIAGLAERINAAPRRTATESTILNRRAQRIKAQQLLKRIDEMSDAEIETLLSRPN